jgi:hypothetical protein
MLLGLIEEPFPHQTGCDCRGQRPQASRLAFVMLAELRSAGHYAHFRSRVYLSLQRSDEHQILETAIIRGGQDFRAPHALVAGTDIADDAHRGRARNGCRARRDPIFPRRLLEFS